MFELSLRQLNKRDCRLQAAGTVQELGLDLEPLEFQGPIHVEIEAGLRGDLVLVRGRVTGKVRRTCCRCLKGVWTFFETSVDVHYRRGKDPAASGFEKEKELTEDEALTVFFEGETFSIREEIREAILLDEPMKFLCSEDCSGLCPECGIDRNTGHCRCSRVFVDPRWSKLENWDKNK